MQRRSSDARESENKFGTTNEEKGRVPDVGIWPWKEKFGSKFYSAIRTMPTGLQSTSWKYLGRGWYNTALVHLYVYFWKYEMLRNFLTLLKIVWLDLIRMQTCSASKKYTDKPPFVCLTPSHHFK